MKLFDPHVHMTSRTIDDYRAMAAAGVAIVVEPASWLGQPRAHVGSFDDQFASMIGWERFRAGNLGIRHFTALALNPREANNLALAQGVIDLLPRYLPKEGVVAVGEIGFDEMTPEEERVFARQIDLACRHDLPILVHTPERDRKRGALRSLALVRELGFPVERVLVEHNNEETLPLVLDAGCWAGHSIYTNSGLDEERMVALVKRYGAERILVSSAADWDVSDPLAVPRTAERMRRSGIAEETIHRIAWKNPIAFFAQSGKLDPAEFGEAPARGPAPIIRSV